jgi:uncharacterized protein YjiS (DUF1127 family)
MTQITHNTHTAPGQGFFERIGNAATGLLSYWRSRSSLHQLQQLDDRMLADIGITRDDLTWAEYLPSSRNPISELARCRQGNIKTETPLRQVSRCDA